jgi:hypothetical protein
MSKPLLQKLGYQPGKLAAVINCPIDLIEVFAGLVFGQNNLDWQLHFCTNRAAIDDAVEFASNTYQIGGHLWFAYRKSKNPKPGDINRDRGWEGLTALGFLPVTQIAINQEWSALRFRQRAEIKKLTRSF